VRQHYQLVKDVRTGLESGNPAAGLDGAIDPFIEAALAQRIKGGDSIVVKDLE
jgi:peptide chain release factor 2